MVQILMKDELGAQTATTKHLCYATPFISQKIDISSTTLHIRPYLFKLLKILGIQLVFHFWNICSFTIVYYVPVNSFKPRMRLNKQTIGTKFMLSQIKECTRELTVQHLYFIYTIGPKPLLNTTKEFAYQVFCLFRNLNFLRKFQVLFPIHYLHI